MDSLLQEAALTDNPLIEHSTILRLFLAIDLPEAQKQVLHAGCQTLRAYLPGLRWVTPEHYHLTLRFLGDTSSTGLRSIEALMEEVAHRSPALPLQLDQWGSFPDRRRTRVIWAGVSGEGLADLVSLANELMRLFPSHERKPFAPHITLARAPINPLALPRDWELRHPLSAMPWLAGEIHLMASTLTPTGSRYQILKSAALAKT
ncbi:MAG: RNA 2',3'-cyclic phosphodiesterase [Magnetococcales bacterium]|nr:RNA 2',3'-cyclic phosphodiesterase [Magnetococcales bacterium]